MQATPLQGRQRGLDQQTDRRGLAPADLVRPRRRADPPFDIGKDSCPLVDLDGEVPPVYNDCNTPLQSRLFRRPFFDTPDLGHAVPDWEAYWTDTANHRTRAFEWDWRNQDYPHPDGTRYEPPTDHARVRLWLRPEGFIFDLYPIPTHFSDVMNIEAALIPRVWALLTNYDIEYLFPTSPLVPDNPLGPFGPVGPVGPVFVHPLAWGHGGAEVEPYLWADPPEDAATAGLLVKRFNPVNGEITALMRSVQLIGTPPYTAHFALARWPSGTLYVFGGQTRSGVLVPRMWLAEPRVEGEEVLYSWIELEIPTMPAGRADAVLVADADRGRLLLLLGRDENGSTAEAQAFDVQTQTWSTVALRVPGLDRVDSVGYSADSQRVFVYGGKTDGELRGGLFEIDLATLTGWRVDDGGGPGPRAHVALQYVPASRQVYLYGGSSGALHGDVWRFDLRSRKWQVLSEDGTPGGPQPSQHGAVLISPSDGAINVLPGSTDDGSVQPAWQLRAGVWKSYEQLLDPEP